MITVQFPMYMYVSSPSIHVELYVVVLRLREDRLGVLNRLLRWPSRIDVGTHVYVRNVGCGLGYVHFVS